MKKSRLILITLLGLVLFSFQSCNDDTTEPEKTISYDELPEGAKSFLDDYFYDYEVMRVGEETVRDIILYQVTLDGDFIVEFNYSGEWLQVTAPENTAIPNIGFIPEVIRQSLNYNYSGYGVRQINKEGDTGYKIELVTGVNLYYNMSGELVPGPGDSDF